MKKRTTQKLLKSYIWDEYIPYLKDKRDKQSAFNRDVGVLKIICSYAMSEKKMYEINENDLDVFFHKLALDRRVSTPTLNRYRSRLHAIFNHAIKARVLEWNPVSQVKRHKEVARDRCLTVAEVARLLYNCKISVNPELHIAVTIALYTGMRLNEVLGLCVSNISGDFIHLRGNQTKSKTDRKIPIHKEILSYISDLAKDKDSESNLFKTKDIRSAFMTALKRANIKDFRFHDLRRTFASNLLAAGADLHIIKNLLGHSSLKMTEVYLSSDSNKSIDAINKLWFGKGVE